MSPTLMAAGIVTLLSVCLFVWLFRRLGSSNRLPAVSPEWLRQFSVARYRPLERLLNEDDYRFLAAQRGYHPRIARRLRAERRRVFRQYLACLRRDFNRLETAARILMVSSPADRPDFARALLKQRLWFTYATMSAEIRLLLHSLGLTTVDVRGLLASLDVMRTQLIDLTVAQRVRA